MIAPSYLARLATALLPLSLLRQAHGVSSEVDTGSREENASK
jgi:hypothetical protein